MSVMSGGGFNFLIANDQVPIEGRVLRGSVKIFSRRGTYVHKQAKPFEPDFFIRKTFYKMFKPGGQNCPPNW